MRRFGSVASGLFACLAACGDDGGTRHLADAAPLDDAAPDAAVATAVNITAYARFYEPFAAKTLRAGVVVIAVDTNGTVTGTVTTDATGTASVELPNGGSITAVYPEDPDQLRTWSTTYFGVQPGDHLTFGDSYSTYSASSASLGSMLVTWPAVTNATDYRVYSPCSNGDYYAAPTTTATIDLNASCATPTAPIAVIASNAGNVIASVFLPATAFTNGTSLTLAANQWVAQAGSPNYNVTLTGLAAEANVRELGAYYDYGKFGSDQYVSGASQNAGTATAAVSVPSTAVTKTARARLSHQTAAGRQYYYKSGASPVSIAASLPWIEQRTIDEALRTVSWTQGAGTYDMGAMRAYWYHSDGKVSHQFVWTAILPPGVNQIDASTLPPELAPYVPNTDDGFYVINVRLIDLANATSYDAARALPEWQAMTPDRSVRSGEAPSAFVSDGGEGNGFWDFF